MAIFNIQVWHKIHPDSQPVWEANVLATSVDEAYRIGKTRFATEHPDQQSQDYIVIATGDSVEKSISV